jgi:regulation of enolase protein 1 (concanavalin A-like superfamily)
LTLIVDLDERGWFKAHVEDQDGKIVFEFSNEDETGWPSEDGLWLVEAGFMRHVRDADGLLEYLKDVGIAKPTATMRVEG